MATTYKATFINAVGQPFNAVLFLSSVTITIRYTSADGVQTDLYVLADEVTRLEQGPLDHILYFSTATGMKGQLILRDRTLQQQVLHTYRSYPFTGRPVHRLFNSARSKFLLLTAMVLLFLASLYFFLVPWIAEKIAMNFSKEYEMKLGDAFYEASIKGMEVDTMQTRLINEFYTVLNYQTGYPIKITVVKSPIVNAFAQPGGHIVVYDAILEGLKTPEQLAALLGHEASHIAARHTLRNIFRSIGRKLFISMVVGNDAGIFSYVADNADDLKSLEFSRALEMEADDNGLRLMYEAGLNTQGMTALMEMLRSESGGEEPSSFMSTHPIFKDRIEHIEVERKKYTDSKPTPAKLRSIFHALFE